MKIRAIILFSVLFSPLAWSQTVQEKIISYSVKNMGKKVDRGECWDLAAGALTAANAEWESPYNFGDKVDYKKGLLPADILQFTNVKFAFPFGSATFPKHTAIVYTSNKNSVTLLHQNFNKKRFVDTLTLNFDQIKNGTVQAYRPREKH